MNNGSLDNVEHFAVLKDFRNGSYVMLSCVAMDDEVFIKSITGAGCIDFSKLRIEHRDRIYKLPPSDVCLQSQYGKSMNQLNFRVEMMLERCDNLEYLEWKDEQHYS